MLHKNMSPSINEFFFAKDDHFAFRSMFRGPDAYAFSLYDAISRDPSSFDRIITPLEDMDTKMIVMAFAVARNSAAIVQSFLDIGMIAGSPQDTLGTGECNLNSEMGYAVMHSADAVVEVLLAARADPNTTTIYEGYPTSVIVPAIKKKSVTIVKQLLDAKCDISSCRQGRGCSSDYHDRIPVICIAAMYGNVEIISLILEANADVNAPNCFGNTALHLAALYDQPRFETTKVSLVALHNQRPRDVSTMIRMLVAGGAFVDAKNYRGQTPLEVLCLENLVDYIPVFLELGADPFRRDCVLRMREPILSLRPEATYFHVHPKIKDAALALVLCRAADEAHPFCNFPPEMLIQLLHEMSCIFVLGY